LRVGETARLLIPSHLAYGSQGQATPPVAGNTPIRMDVKLVSSRTEEQQITDYISSTALTSSLSLTAPPTNITQTANGVRVLKTVTNPTGATITPGQSVTVNYSGLTLKSPQPFDRVSNGTFSFVLGRDQLISGFTEGIQQLRVGERGTVIFPSSLGYGTRGSQNASGQYVIFPYTPLRFDLEVINAK
jgi:FKBP-type peptidyl-prolyl cis-trans isomerase